MLCCLDWESQSCVWLQRWATCPGMSGPVCEEEEEEEEDAKKKPEPDGNHTPSFPPERIISHTFPLGSFLYLQKCVLPPCWGCCFTRKWSLNCWNVDDSQQVGHCLSICEVVPGDEAPRMRSSAITGLADPEQRSCDVDEAVTDLRLACFPAVLRWAIGHMFELLVPTIKMAFLGWVTCAFSDKAGEWRRVQEGRKKISLQLAHCPELPWFNYLCLVAIPGQSNSGNTGKTKRKQKEERQSQIFLC